MKINIVCEDDGWIYGKFVEMFKKYSNHTILVNSKEQCDAVHYLPYYLVPKRPEKPCTSWQSHMETKDPLKAKFLSAARDVDIPISHSKKYADILKKTGIEHAKQIIPGVDLEIYKQRSAMRPVSKKLIVGYSGRQYQSSNRKNPKLLKKISELSFVDFKATNGEVKQKDMPEFYANCDIVVQPSSIEGGSMAIQESLAVGVPILCFKGVGVADEFSHGVIKVPFGNNEDFISRLEVIWKTKSYLTWREAGRMNLMRQQVKNQTWERFVRLHDRTWEMICK
jgi:glycosyltransferase involved in cell wall biosynthesis